VYGKVWGCERRPTRRLTEGREARFLWLSECRSRPRSTQALGGYSSRLLEQWLFMKRVSRKKPTSKQPITSLSTYLEEVERIVLEWAPRRQFYPWFRGHGESTWPLTPRVYRPEFRKILDENQYRYQFKLRAFPYLLGTAREPLNEWEWYFLMQHYGLPTRLLDWSTSALVGLYFALRDTTGDRNAVVWVLDPWALNKKIARKGEKILIPGAKQIQGYLPEPLSYKSIPRNPIALEPSLNSSRITAQRGAFTLHGSMHKALDKYAELKPHLRKIEIANRRIPIIKEQLFIAGITETSVFPELAGLCRELLDYWKYEGK
jgi:FRG domain